MKVHLIFLLVLTASPALAQQSIKIAVANNAVLIPLTMNGRALNFLLDTGSERSVLDASVASSLELRVSGDTQISRNYQNRLAATVDAPNIDIGRLHVGEKMFVVLNLISLSRALGTKVDGVLGTDILRHLTFRLNYSKNVIVFGPLQRLGGLGKPLTLRRSGERYFLTLRIASLPTELLLDTGTNSTNLSWATWQRISRVWTSSSTIEGIAGASTAASSAFLMCAPSIELNDFALTNQPIRVQRAVHSGAFSENNFGGILGSDILRQFEITLDLGRNTIYLKRDTHFQSNPYRYVTVGLQFAPNDRGSYSVMSVWKNSPADSAGIRLGDHIIAINGTRSASLTTKEVSEQLHGPEGTPVNLIIERNGGVFAVSLKTHTLLCNEDGRSNSLRAARP